MTTTPTPQQLVEHVLATSTSHHSVAIAQSSTSANLRWANNTLTTNGEMRAQVLTVIAFAVEAAGVRVGSVTGTATSLAQATALTEAADAAARSAEFAEDAAELVAGVAAADWALPPEETGIGVYADIAVGLGESFGQARAGGRVLYGFIDHEVTTSYLGSSAGLRLRHVQPTGHWGCTAKTSDLASSAWLGGSGRDFSALDAAGLDQTLARRLGWAARTVALPAGRYDTVLPPSSVADLLIYAYWNSAARVAHEGQSVYSRRGGGTRISERIVSPQVQVFSDPAYPGLQAAPFVIAPSSSVTGSVFDNGLPLARTDWIRDGVLSALMQTRHTSALTGQPTTPGIDNLVLEVDGGSGSVDDLVADVERGLLVTSLWYIREVDPQSLLLTGLTRDGVYLVENGEVTGAVNNFRFNESPIDLLQRFSAAGTTAPSFSREWGDYFPRTATPALRVPDFNMSSVSQAQ
ncbi:metallopeptidase TldD-related protein [Nocardioides limicola]|uniref:metallopeptidase TldD-related protein n=1 Tax=Nocardioides limicola TaxID=2803368 RepID=UPI00193BAB1A|nr:metallopeptidase TldD-related protein [Nocardioides sp. DJM-14]